MDGERSAFITNGFKCLIMQICRVSSHNKPGILRTSTKGGPIERFCRQHLRACVEDMGEEGLLSKRAAHNDDDDVVGT